jgi:hypothetical protein
MNLNEEVCWMELKGCAKYNCSENYFDAPLVM